MTVNTGAFLQQQYGLVQAVGDKAIMSDAVFVIDGFEHLRLLTKSFPWPILSPGEPVEIAMPNGGMTGQPSQTRTFFQGQVTMYETEKGHIEAFSRSILAAGGRFNATIYEGSMESYARAVRIANAWFVMDPAERDWEARMQAMQFNCQLAYNYFGETLPGNR